MENNKTPSERATELYHHGTKGMKWGRRRWQNKDGSLTDAGRKRYGSDYDNDKKKDTAFKFKAPENESARQARNIRRADTWNELGLRVDAKKDARRGALSEAAEVHNKFMAEETAKANNDSDANRRESAVGDAADRLRNTARANNDSDDTRREGAVGDAADKRRNTAQANANNSSASNNNNGGNNNNNNNSLRDKNSKTDAERKAEFNRQIGQMQGASKALNAATDIARTLKNDSDNAIRNAPKVKLDLSNMTDAQLRSAIDRGRLEQQYNDMFAPSTVTQGQLTMNKMLSGITTALAIGGSAVSLAIGIRQLLNK